MVGINQHEAQAFARWAARRGGETVGAVVQHEYQWEAAARLGALQGTGRAWKWCANRYRPYDGYRRPSDPEQASRGFEAAHASLRGGCLHTRQVLRRTSLRHAAAPSSRHLFSGTRLVFPPQ